MQFDPATLKPTIAERNEALQLWEAMDATEKACEEAESKPASEVSDAELGRLHRVEDAARKAWEANPISFGTDDDWRPMHCALTGILVTEDDEIVRDDRSDKVALRVAVFGPLPEAKEGELDDASRPVPAAA
jgi:hypothetical protein